MISHIVSESSSVNQSCRYLFAQVGVADSYPCIIQGICREDKIRNIKDKCERMISAILWNGNRVNISRIYAYANQSMFELSDVDNIDPYSIRDSVMDSVPGILQLYPSCTIDRYGSIVLKSDYVPLIDYRLKRLTQEFVDYILIKSSLYSSPLLDISFACFTHNGHVPTLDNHIVVASSLHQWNRTKWRV